MMANAISTHLGQVALDRVSPSDGVGIVALLNPSTSSSTSPSYCHSPCPHLLNQLKDICFGLADPFDAEVTDGSWGPRFLMVQPVG